MKSILYPILFAVVGLVQMRGRAEMPLSTPANGIVITSDFIARLMDEAATNNPALLAANYRAKSAAANVGSIRDWDDPMFTIGGSIYSPRGMDPSQVGDLTYGISEKLPLWGIPKLSRQIAAAESSVNQTEADF